jgi:uncharacterized paraquat-inducible protein A
MKSKTCPHCDLVVTADALFCPRCMVQLREPRLNFLGRMMPWALLVALMAALAVTTLFALDLKGAWLAGTTTFYDYLKLLVPSVLFIGFWLLSIPLMSFVRTK